MMKADYIIPISYWLGATMAVIWGDFLANDMWGRSSLQLSRCIWATGACSGAVGIIVYSIRKARGSKLLPPFVGIVLIALAVPYICEDIRLRKEFLMFMISGCVSVYLAMRYYDDITHTATESLSLMHRRYLGYFRSGVWIIAFVLVGYFYWELRGLPPPAEPNMKWMVLSFLQLAASVAGGTILVAYGLTQRLNELETRVENMSR